MTIQNDFDIKLEINNNKFAFTLKYVEEIKKRLNLFLDNNYSEINKYLIYVNKLVSVVDIAFAAELLMKINCLKNGLSEEELLTHDLNKNTSNVRLK